MEDLSRQRIRELRQEYANLSGGIATFKVDEVKALLDMAERSLPAEPLPKKCAAAGCDNSPDPRFPLRTPDGTLVFLCDGCPRGPFDPPDYHERLMQRVLDRLSSPEGQARLVKSAETARERAREIVEGSRVDDEFLTKRVNL